MKSNRYTLISPTILFGVIITAALTLLLTSLKFNQTDSIAYTQEIKKEKKYKKGGFFNAERAGYEFQLLRDPSTGKIPAGIRQDELALAANIPTEQDLNTPGVLGNFNVAVRGPSNIGGRTRSLFVDIANDNTGNTIFAGGVTSGLFRSTDGGVSWTRVSFTNDLHSVTSIAQDRNNPSVLLYSTGEGLPGDIAHSVFGDGIWKSTDAGSTWNQLAATASDQNNPFDNPFDFISRIAVHPITSDYYAATYDGIYRSQDGGTTWDPVLGVLAGFPPNVFLYTDLFITASGRLYASFDGGTGLSDAVDGLPINSEMNGVWTSASGNPGTWNVIGNTLNEAAWPLQGTYGRIVLAGDPSDQDVVYAYMYNNSPVVCGVNELPEAYLFRWDFGGGNWTNLTGNLPNEGNCLENNDPLALQGGYNMAIAVDPSNSSRVVLGGTNLYISTDKFSTELNVSRIGGYLDAFSYLPYNAGGGAHHWDIHTLVFDPLNSDNLYTGTDGGIHKGDISVITPNWVDLNTNYITTQYYSVYLDPNGGNTGVSGGTLDNGYNFSPTAINDFKNILLGDGGDGGMNEEAGNSQKVYASAQFGDLKRITNVLMANPTVTDIDPNPDGSGLFITKFLLDPDNTNAGYYADADTLYRNTSMTTATPGNWTELTGVTNTMNFEQIRSMAVTRGAYNASSVLFIGTDGGNIFRLDDPQNALPATVPVAITPPGMGNGINVVSDISVDPTNDNNAIAVYSNYGVQSVWYTTNAKAPVPAWTAIESNISLFSFRSCEFIIDGLAQPRLFVGTSAGLYSTFVNLLNGNATVWFKEGDNNGEIGNALVTSLAYRPSDNILAIATYGNGLYTLDLNNPLPIELVNFAAAWKNGTPELVWRTSFEDNNKKFEIYRKTDGEDAFIKIGESPSKGNTETGHNYTFTDFSVSSTAKGIYYRLKQVDFDNKYSLSDIIYLNNEGNNGSASLIRAVYPNPTAEYLSIRLNNDLDLGNGQYAVKIMDLTGAVVFESKYSSADFNIRTEGLAKGAYLLLVNNGSTFQTERFMIQ